MARLPNVRLDLTNKPENVLLVREALAGVAETVGLDGSDLSDIRTAVTEACNNVVLHAYSADGGPLEVEIELRGETTHVSVRDHGVGIGADALDGETDGGIGLPVIRALASAVEFSEPPGGGTEVSRPAPGRLGELHGARQRADDGQPDPAVGLPVAR